MLNDYSNTVVQWNVQLSILCKWERRGDRIILEALGGMLEGKALVGLLWECGSGWHL